MAVLFRGHSQAHLLLYSLVFGSTAYQSFFVGIASFRALERESFSKLQSAIFPVYFPAQFVGSVLLLAAPPVALGSLARYGLIVSLVSAALNAFWLGPVNTRLLKARDSQARSEGVPIRSPQGSDKLKQLNREFGRAHGISVLSNLATFGGLLAYGVALGALIV